MGFDKFYFEKMYSKKKYIFEFVPNYNIIKDILYYKKNGKIIDLGCGEGGTCIELQKKGFDVTATDISKTAIKKIAEVSLEKNLRIKTICCDLEKIEFCEKYDIFISTGTLHLLNKKKVIELLEKCKKNTEKEGIHIFEFMINMKQGFTFDLNFIKEIYFDWNVEKYQENEKFAYVVLNKV